MGNRRVEREYLDEDLRRLATEPEFRPLGWSDCDISGFHRLVQCARAAYVDTDMLNLRVLRIEPDPDDPSRARARLRSRRAIDLTFKNSDSHGTVVFELSTRKTEAQR